MADNIRLGSKWITDEQLEQAADDVNVGDFIRSLPLKFAEPVQERGGDVIDGAEAADQLCAGAGAPAWDFDFG